MPKLSPTMEEGQLSRWLKKEGDKVSMGEPLAEVDTDKATMEAPALTTGVLRKILIPEGQSVPLGATIAIIGEADEDISSLLDSVSAPEAKPTESDSKAEQASPIPPSIAVSQGAQTVAASGYGTPPGGAKSLSAVEGNGKGKEVSSPDTTSGNGTQQSPARLVISPIAARMAAEAGINLQSVTGSGPGGRIVKRDIEAARNAAAAQPTPSEQSPKDKESPQISQPQTPAQQSAVQGAASFRDVPNTEMRRTIARRLTSSIGPVPHFFLTTEIEMDAASDLRNKLKEIDEQSRVSFNDIIIKVAATALMSHPQVNASFQDQMTRYYEAADLGVAVAIKDGLITPVIRAANTKSIGAISREIRELAERARARRLRPEEYTGATFSVSNLGMFGIDEFTAVINPPEAAILAVGAVTPKPVIQNGEVVVRQMMRVTMSCDHRVVDGATGAQFLQTFKQLLENPLRLLIA